MPSAKVCPHGHLARTCEICDLQAELSASAKEAAFYRERLEQIAALKRRTREQRLASSALSFYDALRREAPAEQAIPVPSPSPSTLLAYAVVVDIDWRDNGNSYDTFAAPDDSRVLSLSRPLDGSPVDESSVVPVRAPVFVLGEILVLDTNGREVSGHGRKPSKWGVPVEMFPDIASAVARAREFA